jgi:hypothetical protein
VNFHTIIALLVLTGATLLLVDLVANRCFLALGKVNISKLFAGRVNTSALQQNQMGARKSAAKWIIRVISVVGFV